MSKYRIVILEERVKYASAHEEATSEMVETESVETAHVETAAAFLRGVADRLNPKKTTRGLD